MGVAEIVLELVGDLSQEVPILAEGEGIDVGDVIDVMVGRVVAVHGWGVLMPL